MKPRLPMKHSKAKIASYKGMVYAISVLAVVGIVSVVLSGGSPTSTVEETISLTKQQKKRSGSLTTTTTTITTSRTTTQKEKSFDETPLIPSEDKTTEAKAQPLERRIINHVDVLYQRPSESSPPKGILFVAHGCSHSATDWWPSTTTTSDGESNEGNCPECIGLPEEQAIVELAVQEYQYMVVAISSVNRESKCWSSRDGPRVAEVLKELYTTTIQKSTPQDGGNNHNKIIPIIAFGASSGGNFVGRTLPETMQALELPLWGFISQIAAPPPPPPSTNPKTTYYPVATYITMDRDHRTDEAAQEIVEQLSAKKLLAKQIRVGPLPLTTDFFQKQIPHNQYSMEESKAMVEALEHAQYIDPSTKQLLKNPRGSNWRDILRPLVGQKQGDEFVPDESPISEIMNVAWAGHELTRDGVKEAMDFIIKGQQQQQEQLGNSNTT